MDRSTDPPAPLALNGVSAGYERSKTDRVLGDVDLELATGTITGLLGRNGSGKTTLMRVAIGLMRARTGTAKLFGVDSWDSPGEVRKRIGYVPQRFSGFGWMTVDACLAMIGGHYDSWDQAFINDLKREWRLANRRIDKLSPGDQQKVAILLAVGHKPDLLLLDEPAASLDAAARRNFMKALAELNVDRRQTVLLSSHDALCHSSPRCPTGRRRLVGDLGVRHAMRCRLRRSTTTPGPTGPILIGTLSCLDTASRPGGYRLDPSRHATCPGPANDWHRPDRPVADRVRKLCPRGSPEGSVGRCSSARHAHLDVVLLSQVYRNDLPVRLARFIRLRSPQLVGMHGPRPTVTRLDLRYRAGSRATRATGSGSRRLDVTSMACTRNWLVGHSCLCNGPGGRFLSQGSPARPHRRAPGRHGVMPFDPPLATILSFSAMRLSFGACVSRECMRVLCVLRLPCGGLRVAYLRADRRHSIDRVPGRSRPGASGGPDGDSRSSSR